MATVTGILAHAAAAAELFMSGKDAAMEINACPL